MKSPAKCPNCGHAAKVESRVVTRSGVEITDDYCGHCGVNWGVVKPAKLPRKGERRSA